jgi:hypothetical protein
MAGGTLQRGDAATESRHGGACGADRNASNPHWSRTAMRASAAAMRQYRSS